MSTSPRLVGVGGLFIDDIVRPDGRTYMGELGGGVVHALMGATIWGERPGIVAPMGRGLPAESLDRLHQYFDTQGLYALELPQARAWQVFEPDGTRRELYRVSVIAPYVRGPQPNDMPQSFRAAQGFFLLQDLEGIRHWRSTVRGLILWEPLQQIMVPQNRNLFRQTLRECAIEVVSPNLAEAQAIYGALPPEGLIQRMMADGARIVALRMGEAGSMVASRDSGKPTRIPAVPVASITDETGAGNAYGGGLLWGLVAGKTLPEAAAAGAVAASFCVETVGVIKPERVDPAERDRRYRELLGR